MKISWKQIAAGMLAVMMMVVMAGCGGTKDSAKPAADSKLKVVATTTMLADLSRQIGGDAVEVTGLMGAGVDPHLYQASAGDVKVMSDADVVVYNGLHLEGKMGEIFGKLEQDKKTTICVADNLDPATLLKFEEDGVEATDPHIWFDVKNWMLAAEEVYKGLAEKDPAHKDVYKANYDKYLGELKKADEYVAKRAAEVPQDQRVLITAHDAFQYFARAYDFKVKGLQGVSTEAEAGAIDVRELSDFIVDHQIHSIFVESSVPHKTIEAVQEACKAKGWDVKIGGELYSDSCGAPGTPGGDYIGMVKANIDTIVSGLK